MSAMRAGSTNTGDRWFNWLLMSYGTCVNQFGRWYGLSLLSLTANVYENWKGETRTTNAHDNSDYLTAALV